MLWDHDHEETGNPTAGVTGHSGLKANVTRVADRVGQKM